VPLNAGVATDPELAENTSAGCHARGGRGPCLCSPECCEAGRPVRPVAAALRDAGAEEVARLATDALAAEPGAPRVAGPARFVAPPGERLNKPRSPGKG